MPRLRKKRKPRPVRPIRSRKTKSLRVAASSAAMTFGPGRASTFTAVRKGRSAPAVTSFRPTMRTSHTPRRSPLPSTSSAGIPRAGKSISSLRELPRRKPSRWDSIPIPGRASPPPRRSSSISRGPAEPKATMSISTAMARLRCSRSKPSTRPARSVSRRARASRAST